MDIETNGTWVRCVVAGVVVSGVGEGGPRGGWSWWVRDVRGGAVRIPAATRKEAVNEAVAAAKRWGVR